MQIDLKQIPDEVVEAAAKERYERANPDLKWENCADELGAAARQRILHGMRKDIAAALAAWPGARERPFWDLMTSARHVEIILPQEARDE